MVRHILSSPLCHIVHTIFGVIYVPYCIKFPHKPCIGGLWTGILGRPPITLPIGLQLMADIWDKHAREARGKTAEHNDHEYQIEITS